jgi:hypothetical protein
MTMTRKLKKVVLTLDQFQIVSAALLALCGAETFPTRLIRAAEKTQGVAPVAGGTEEMEAIESTILDAFGAFWSYTFDGEDWFSTVTDRAYEEEQRTQGSMTRDHS